MRDGERWKHLRESLGHINTHATIRYVPVLRCLGREEVVGVDASHTSYSTYPS